jgi:hypothetical protein
MDKQLGAASGCNGSPVVCWQNYVLIMQARRPYKQEGQRLTKMKCTTLVDKNLKGYPDNAPQTCCGHSFSTKLFAQMSHRLVSQIFHR